jgi:hypothetical protein
MSRLLLRMTVLAGFLSLLNACGREPPPDGPGSDAGMEIPEGNVTVRVTTTRQVPAFTVSIQNVNGGQTLALQVVEPEADGVPGSYSYEEALFELPTGRYIVVALPHVGPGAPFGTCGSAQDRAIVETARTTEIELSPACAEPAADAATSSSP